MTIHEIQNTYFLQTSKQTLYISSIYRSTPQAYSKQQVQTFKERQQQRAAQEQDSDVAKAFDDDTKVVDKSDDVRLRYDSMTANFERQGDYLRDFLVSSKNP